MGVTIKEVKESLLKKKRRNILCGIITLCIAILLWITIVNTEIWLLIIKSIISLISILFFVLAYSKHKSYKSLVKDTKAIDYSIHEKDTFSKNNERKECMCNKCGRNCNCGKK